MNQLSPKQLHKILKSPQEFPSVTLYMPTHRTASPPHINEDQIRFKNLRQRVAGLMDKNTNLDSSTKQRINQNLEQLQDDLEFWGHQAEGLAILASSEILETIQLPMETDEYAAVDGRFHLSPLLGMLQVCVGFYVLAISEKNMALYEGSPYAIKKMEARMPNSLKEALNIDELHLKSVQHHTGNKEGGAQYHGHGGSKDSGHEEWLDYLRIIDKKLKDNTDGDRLLILAGGDSETADFKSLTTYPKVADESLPNLKDESEINKQAWSIVRKEILNDRRELADSFQRLSAETPKRAVLSLGSIKQAASEGRVESLLIRMLRRTTDSVRDSLTRHSKVEFLLQDDMDELDEAATLTSLQGGQVYLMDENDMPNSSKFAAILRY